MNVTFKFEIDQKVLIPLGTEGIVTSLSVDNTKINQAFVKTQTGESWWREDQLSAV